MASSASRMADREGLLSEDPMGSHEKYQWSRPERRTCMTTLQSFSWLVNMVLLMINTIGLLYLVHYMGAPGSISPLQVGGDYTHEGPTFLTTIQKWKADPDFTPLTATEFLKPKTQAKWETLIPAGFNFGEDGKVYNTTSVTHQLHCVYIMGKIFSSVLSNSTDIGIPSDYEAHFLHCVDYMRQAAMCAGDVAIEPRDKNGSPGPVTLENAFNGYHVCKNYGQVKSYLEEQVKEGVRNILPIDD
ncbi:Oxidase ustYa [Apiospora arundinis]|uniref:Oxidase ustYa n=1 Tax=Apiospora arundinis TaxID=335852 RepID=A0ABR2ISM5_9PEZI